MGAIPYHCTIRSQMSYVPGPVLEWRSYLVLAALACTRGMVGRISPCLCWRAGSAGSNECCWRIHPRQSYQCVRGSFSTSQSFRQPGGKEWRSGGRWEGEGRIRAGEQKGRRVGREERRGGEKERMWKKRNRRREGEWKGKHLIASFKLFQVTHN